MKRRERTELIHTLELLLAAFIWGTTFAAQSEGAKLIDPYTFLAVRGWLGTIFLTFVVMANDKIMMKRIGRTAKPENKYQRRQLALLGTLCGTNLFIASILQQYGIEFTTTAKTSFITALYVVMVPLFSIFAKKMPSGKIWICVLLSVIGLYFLCMKPGAIGFSYGDRFVLAGAVFFALQILSVHYGVSQVDGIRLAWWQTFSCGVYSTIAMLLFGTPSAQQLWAAFPTIAYAGILSTGVAYTLQIVGQKHLNPTIASLAMCMESVFGALAGWVVQGQSLTYREMAGCAIMFSAIVLSNLNLSIKGDKKNEDGTDHFSR